MPTTEFNVCCAGDISNFQLCSHRNSLCLQVHVHVKRHQLADLPGTDEGVSQWCKDIFVAKA